MNAWLPSNIHPDTGNPRLFCFPHAGGGAAVYHRWNRELPTVDFVPINLPGREARIDETPFEDLKDLLQEMLPAVSSLCNGRFSIFGYSMGALIAFEFTRLLRASALPLPEHLFVAACRAPQLPLGREPIHVLDDAAMTDHLVNAYGLDASTSAEERSLMMLMSGTIRADLALFERYEYEDHPPLALPITAIGGANDPQLSRAQLEGWRAQTTQKFKSRLLPGHHFFHRTQQPAILDLVQSEFDRLT